MLQASLHTTSSSSIKNENGSIKEQNSNEEHTKHTIIENNIKNLEDTHTHKTVITSMKKGRFLIETARTEKIDTTKKARLQNMETQQITEDLIRVVAKQNTQIELLYEMIRNISGNDKLFEKELNYELISSYEMINDLKKKIGRK